MSVKTVYVTMRIPVRLQSNRAYSSAFIYLSLMGADAKTEREAIQALRANMNAHIRSLKRFHRQEKRQGRG